MTSGTQNTVIENMAKTGCYFLCLCEISERITHMPVDAIETAIVAQKSGWIKKDFTIVNPDKLLHFLTGKNFNVSITTEKPANYLYYVEMWHNDRTGYEHFKLPNWDSLTNSVTVREGYIKSYRVLKEV